jgi:L-fucose isomerase-like protein
MAPRFGFTPVVPPFAGAGQVEEVVSEYIAALEAAGGERWDASGYGAPEPLCFLVATGGTESVVLDLYTTRQALVADEPVLLLAHPGNNSLPAALEVLARLHQEGARGRIIYLGAPDDPAGLERLEGALHELEVRRALHSARIGLVGDPSDWLVASSPSPATVHDVWGPEVLPIPMAELTSAVEAADLEAAGTAAAELAAGATDIVEPTADALADVARVHAGLRSVVDSYQLDAITVRCFDLVLDRSTTGCFALAELTDAGVIAGCEGDLVSTIGLMWAGLLTGETPWMANPAHVDEYENTLLLAHCTVPRSLVERYRLRSHFESGLGVGIEGELPLGPVTLLRVGGAMMDCLWLAEGEIVAPHHEENLCRTQAEVRLSRGHVSELLRAPLGNHIVLVYGHHADALAEWWDSML